MKYENHISNQVTPEIIDPPIFSAGDRNMLSHDPMPPENFDPPSDTHSDLPSDPPSDTSSDPLSDPPSKGSSSIFPIPEFKGVLRILVLWMVKVGATPRNKKRVQIACRLLNIIRHFLSEFILLKILSALVHSIMLVIELTEDTNDPK